MALVTVHQTMVVTLCRSSGAPIAVTCLQNAITISFGSCGALNDPTLQPTLTSFDGNPMTFVLMTRH